MINFSVLTLDKNDIKDFAEERNLLLSKSKNRWNLFLDKDEKMPKIDQISINTSENHKKTAFYLFRKNYFLGQYVGTDKIIRIVKKGTGKFIRVVHEVWIPKESRLVSVMPNNYIVHYTADNLNDYLNKMNNYSTLHAKANLNEGKKSNLFKIIFFPIGKFIVTLIKSKHVVFSIMQSLHSYLSWTKLYFLQS